MVGKGGLACSESVHGASAFYSSFHGVADLGNSREVVCSPAGLHAWYSRGSAPLLPYATVPELELEAASRTPAVRCCEQAPSLR